MVSSCDVASKMVLINRFQCFDEMIKEGPQRIIMLFNFLKVIICFEVRHPRCVSNKSKCNVYTICRQTQLSTG